MRPLSFAFVVAAVLAGASAVAQPAPRRTPAAPVTRYLSFSEGTLAPDLPATVDGVLKLTGAGREIRSADVDICFQTQRFSLRLDRVAVPLQVQAGNLLIGTSPGLDGITTSIRVRRTEEDGGTYKLEGEINRQDLRLTFSGSGLELAEEDPLEVPPDETPASSLLTSPNEFEVTLGLAAVPDFLKLARREGWGVRETNLLPDCRALRAGKVTLTALATPEKLSAATAEAAKLKGVEKTGPVTSFDYDHAVRFRPGAASSPAEIGALIGRAAERAVPGLTAVSSRVDAATGTITVVLRRAAAHLAALGLEERVAVKALLAPAREAGRAIIHLRELEARLVDPAPSPVLLPATSPSEAVEAASAGSDLNTTAALAALADAITREVGGDRIVGEAWVTPRAR